MFLDYNVIKAEYDQIWDFLQFYSLYFSSRFGFHSSNNKMEYFEKPTEHFIEFYMKEHAPDEFKKMLCNHMLE